jgi:uncharacterized membrane protein YccC
LSISPISNQVNNFIQKVSASSSTSDQASISSTPVTSNNPTILTQQEKTIQNEIAQLQQSHGSAQNIRNLNQELQTIQKQLQKVSTTSTQSASQQTITSKSTNLNVKA